MGLEEEDEEGAKRAGRQEKGRGRLFSRVWNQNEADLDDKVRFNGYF